MSDFDGETSVRLEAQESLNRLRRLRSENGYVTPIWNDVRLSRAVHGLSALRQAENLLGPELCKKITDNPGIQMCFLGIVPVEQIRSELSEAEVAELNACLEKIGGGYFAVEFNYAWSKAKGCLLVNSEAAEDVVRQNPDIFKNCDDVKAYLLKSPKDYLAPAAAFSGKTQDIKHGLLAGYPKKCVVRWSDINNSFGPERFLKSNKFGVGNRSEGYYFEGFDEEDRRWANEALALRKALLI
jgi:hypothetical protein